MAAERVRKSRCKACGRMVPRYAIFSVGSVDTGYRNLCTRCFNGEAALAEGLEKFEHADFAPTEVMDCEGKVHVFHFRTWLCGSGLALDAFELQRGEPAGYQFQIIGEPDGEPMALFARLLKRIRRALSVKHIKTDDLGPCIAGMVVKGRIGWDELECGHGPMLVIDGREITWEEFGRMAMTFEGWQFKLEFRDKSDEV